MDALIIVSNIQTLLRPIMSSMASLVGGGVFNRHATGRTLPVKKIELWTANQRFRCYFMTRHRSRRAVKYANGRYAV